MWLAYRSNECGRPLMTGLHVDLGSSRHPCCGRGAGPRSQADWRLRESLINLTNSSSEFIEVHGIDAVVSGVALRIRAAIERGVSENLNIRCFRALLFLLVPLQMSGFLPHFTGYLAAWVFPLVLALEGIYIYILMTLSLYVMSR